MDSSWQTTHEINLIREIGRTNFVPLLIITGDVVKMKYIFKIILNAAVIKDE